MNEILFVNWSEQEWFALKCSSLQCVCCGKMSSLTSQVFEKRVEISVPDNNKEIVSGKEWIQRSNVLLRDLCPIKFIISEFINEHRGPYCCEPQLDFKVTDVIVSCRLSWSPPDHLYTFWVRLLLCSVPGQGSLGQVRPGFWLLFEAILGYFDYKYWMWYVTQNTTEITPCTWGVLVIFGVFEVHLGFFGILWCPQSIKYT